jgi:hypothetical protein
VKLKLKVDEPHAFRQKQAFILAFLAVEGQCLALIRKLHPKFLVAFTAPFYSVFRGVVSFS